MKNHTCSIAIVIAAVSTLSIAQAVPPAVKPSPATPVQVINDTSNPVPVAGTVNVSKTQTTALLEMVGLPKNFSTTTPLDTSTCSSLRVVLKSTVSGPSLLFILTTPVAGNPAAETEYFDTLVPSEGQGSAVVDVPPPVTNVRMGVSGDCPSCALGIYCR
jgi:hypothetical protein